MARVVPGSDDLLPATGTLRKVLVIGAGVAGLQVARQFQRLGCEVLVLEANAQVGGVWQSNYVGFGLQVPWRMYQFAEFPWPQKLQPEDEYPTGHQVQEYILAYAQHFKLLPIVRFNSKLLRLRWSLERRQWDALYCNSEVEKFYKVSADYVVMCSGIYSDPFIPEYQGAEAFAGTHLHAKDFTDHSLARGRRVLIVGAGKTALDCVTGLIASDGAASVTMLYRKSHWPIPRSVLGVSIRRLIFNRAMTHMMPPYYTAGRGAQAGAALAKPLKRLFWMGLECLVSHKYKVAATLKPAIPLPTDLFHGGQILDDRLDRQMENSTLVRGEIKSFVRNGVILTDGSFLPADIVLYATGYSKSYDFLEGGMRARLGIQKDGLYLYRNCLPHAVPHLAFIGSEVSTYNNILTHGLQALWLAHVLSGRVRLPPPAAMAEDVREQQRWRREVMPPQRTRGSVLMIYMMQYHDQLVRDMGQAPRRKGLNLLAECFGVYSATDYGPMLQRADKTLLGALRVQQEVNKEQAGPCRVVRRREAATAQAHHGSGSTDNAVTTAAAVATAADVATAAAVATAVDVATAADVCATARSCLKSPFTTVGLLTSMLSPTRSTTMGSGGRLCDSWPGVMAARDGVRDNVYRGGLTSSTARESDGIGVSARSGFLVVPDDSAGGEGSALAAGLLVALPHSSMSDAARAGDFSSCSGRQSLRRVAAQRSFKQKDAHAVAAGVATAAAIAAAAAVAVAAAASADSAAAGGSSRSSSQQGYALSAMWAPALAAAMVAAMLPRQASAVPSLPSGSPPANTRAAKMGSGTLPPPCDAGHSLSGTVCSPLPTATSLDGPRAAATNRRRTPTALTSTPALHSGPDGSNQRLHPWPCRASAEEDVFPHFDCLPDRELYTPFGEVAGTVLGANRVRGGSAGGPGSGVVCTGGDGNGSFSGRHRDTAWGKSRPMSLQVLRGVRIASLATAGASGSCGEDGAGGEGGHAGSCDGAAAGLIAIADFSSSLPLSGRITYGTYKTVDSSQPSASAERSTAAGSGGLSGRHGSAAALMVSWVRGAGSSVSGSGGGYRGGSGGSDGGSVPGCECGYAWGSEPGRRVASTQTVAEVATATMAVAPPATVPWGKGPNEMAAKGRVGLRWARDGVEVADDGMAQQMPAGKAVPAEEEMAPWVGGGGVDPSAAAASAAAVVGRCITSGITAAAPSASSGTTAGYPRPSATVPSSGAAPPPMPPGHRQSTSLGGNGSAMGAQSNSASSAHSSPRASLSLWYTMPQAPSGQQGATQGGSSDPSGSASGLAVVAGLGRLSSSLRAVVRLVECGHEDSGGATVAVDEEEPLGNGDGTESCGC